MLLRILLAVATCAGLLLAQPNELNLRQDPPAAIQSPQVNAVYTGTAGGTTYYYWISVRYPIGFSMPVAPVVVARAASSLGGGNSVALTWPAMPGASSYDVLRTSTPAAPSSCTCAVTLATTSTTVTDSGGALSAWPPAGLHAAGSANMVLQINNRDGAAPYITMAVQNAQRALNYQLGLLKDGPAPTYVPPGFVQVYADSGGQLQCLNGEGQSCLQQVVSVLSCGAVGDGITDDSAAFQRCANQLAAGGVLFVPKTAPGSYYKACDVGLFSNTLVMGDHTTYAAYSGTYDGPQVYCGSASPIFKQAQGTAVGIGVRNLYLRGDPAVDGKGVYLANCSFCYVEENWMVEFGNRALHWSAGATGWVQHNVASGMFISSGRSGYMGVFDLGVTDLIGLNDNEVAGPFCVPFNSGNCYGPDHIVDGYVACYLLSGGKVAAKGNKAEFCEQGVVVSGAYAQMSETQSEYNGANGYVISNGSGVMIGNFSFSNGQFTDGTYDGFVVTGGHTLFTGNRCMGLSGDTRKQRYCFNDSSNDSSATNLSNRYDITNSAYNITAQIFNISGGTKKLSPIVYQLSNGAQDDTLFTFTGTGTELVKSTSPTFLTSLTMQGTRMNLKDIASPANSRLWDFHLNSPYGQMFFRVLNDAENAGANWLEIYRTGIVVDKVKVPAPFEINTYTFAQLPSATNAYVVYCSNCTKATPCASGGSGAFAKGINGAWDCN